jgi:hypothetical protein
LYVGSDGEIRALPLDAPLAEAKPADLVPGGMNWLGRTSTPLLVGGGRLYVGFVGWGLCALGGGQ